MNQRTRAGREADAGGSLWRWLLAVGCCLLVAGCSAVQTPKAGMEPGAPLMTWDYAAVDRLSKEVLDHAFRATAMARMEAPSHGNPRHVEGAARLGALEMQVRTYRVALERKRTMEGTLEAFQRIAGQHKAFARDMGAARFDPAVNKHVEAITDGLKELAWYYPNSWWR